ncbi:hypothetical protein NC651_014692 [Populus alba x Populus x berolinensis]|nr:hypothetical protein NC651_014692 [Populus alba x Populus x berolinensis]
MSPNLVSYRHCRGCLSLGEKAFPDGSIWLMG